MGLSSQDVISFQLMSMLGDRHGKCFCSLGDLEDQSDIFVLYISLVLNLYQEFLSIFVVSG